MTSVCWRFNASAQEKHGMVIRTDWVVSWVMALLFLLAGFWPYFSSSPFYLPGFESLSAHGEVAKWFQIVAVVLAVLWLSVKRWHSRERFLVFRGGALVLSVQGLIYIGIPFGLAFVMLHNIAVRASKNSPVDASQK